MCTYDNRQDPHNLIDHIFCDLLPAQGMAERPAQIELSHRMLNAMLDGKIALCDAGTGIGKTFAYLAAGIAFSLCRPARGLNRQPIVVSTSSIALQRAMLEEYLPVLSNILLEDGQIDHPLQAVIRKGKSHYVCDRRLAKRLTKANLQKKNAGTVAALLSLRDHLDMDGVAHLSNYDREQVCVPRFCSCNQEDCRYRRFLGECGEGRYLFQICNHNLLLADAICQGKGRRPILPEHPALIIDEAHKLPEAARQMFGVTLCAADFQTMIRSLRAERFLLAAETLDSTCAPLRRALDEPWDDKRPLEDFLRLLPAPDRGLQIIQRQLERELTPPSRSRLAALAAAVSLFCEGNPDMIFYTAPDEKGGAMLCATISNLTAQLRGTLWSQPYGMVLASATLAVGESFRHFKEEVGLLADERVRESVSPSPFDYQSNCLLYLPQFPPRQRGRDYYDKLADEIAALLRAAHGHALVLFTSYAAMSAVKERLKGKVRCPLFTMGRSAVHTAERFKASPGAVLLATGPAWEGFDFPGDCVSLLVIPRLPFAYPDALKEREREGYATLREFIQAVVAPEMQIKFRQGFGRAIRTEDDTCVIAVLDERAIPGHRYFTDIMEALPEMNLTRSLRDVEEFIRNVKSKGYFQEAA